MPGKTFTDIDSPLQTRDEVAQAVESLLDPLKSHFTPGRTCVKLGNTATRYDEIGAQVEGYARPLWGLAALLAGGHEYKGTNLWVDGLKNGTNPDHPEFWGWARDLDQRMVEMCPIGYCLCIAGHKFWEPLSQKEKDNVTAWLGYINNKEMPNTNWLWFRVFANMGLAKNGAPYSQEKMEADMDHLDTFYRDEGFSNDGPEGYTQMDYYSGSFAIQFLQLLYVKIWGDRDPKRAENYRERAKLYAAQFVHYADEEGRLITFGRSLTYRFAMAGFWGAVAFADLELPAPLTWGVVKGILLRNLRWWTKQKEILTSEGTLSIGYLYPNQFMSENYNSPGSPYWFMLSFAPLALKADHPFWTAKEEPYPTNSLPPIRALAQPKHIMVRRGGHTFLLSSGQMCHYPVRASESKYGKFAYSSAFGYSVPTGGYFVEAIGGDNMIAVTEDPAGMGEVWRLRRVAIDAHIEEHDGTPCLVSGWKPWKDVDIDTWLFPPTEEAPNWHVRVHRITTKRDIRTSEGAFALEGMRASDGRELEALHMAGDSQPGDISGSEGMHASGAEALAVTSAGAVGIVELVAKKDREGKVLAADSNGNLYAKRAVLPSLAGEVKAGSTVWGVTAVFALPESVKDWQGVWRKEWEKRPSVPKWLEEKMK